MNSYRRLLILITLCVLVGSLSTAAKPSQFVQQTMYCASDDGRRNYCNADTRNGVTLVRKRSDAACIEGRTWGYDRRGVWVDRGCRADFALGRGNNGGGGGNSGGGPSPGNYDRPNGRVIYSGPITNRGSNKVLDVERPASRDGANVQQWEWANQANQTWDVYDLGNGEVAIISQRSGFALTVQGGNDYNGGNIIQRHWRGTRQQRWRIDRVNGDWARITSVDSGKVLDVSAQSRADGANVQQWDWAEQANQQWRLGRRQ
jgi:Protein of unknown function (DUF3011)/Ricin-type beta-trefoil lectin domain